MTSSPPQPLTEEDYLRTERQALERSEFRDGQMPAMAVSSANHSFLGARICALLGYQVPPECRVFNCSLRLHIPESAFYTYPDCGVVCGEPQYSGDEQDNLLNPLLIVEVLSPSTEGYDRGKKFELYRAIATLREYLLIHQDRRMVEHYSRQNDNSWVLREHAGAEAELSIGSLGVRISLQDLYAAAIGLDS
jgi:Uma2 family endonuclease